MEPQTLLFDFIRNTLSDSRINKGHLSIYTSLFFLWSKQGFTGPLEVYSKDVMPIAKISSGTTFHAMIRELAEYGYINYQPSYYKFKKSIVWLNIKSGQSNIIAKTKERGKTSWPHPDYTLSN